VRYLQGLGHHIMFAGNEWQRNYIDNSFNDIETIHLPGYDVHYGKGSFMLSMFGQLPKLLRAVKEEHNWLGRLVKERKLDGIISDNRYGLYNKSIPSVIMTHQLQIQTGMGMDRTLMRLHYRYLENFAQQWIVDVRGDNNLSGALAHPNALPANAHYIGLLSQLTPAPNIVQGNKILVLLSGPEPQRTVLEELLWKQVVLLKEEVIFVAGSDDIHVPKEIPANVTYHKRLSRQTLQPLIEAAEMVVCRSGYSTLMDLVRLNKKAILIPTPGQTEQEYLGKHLHEQGIFYCAPQKDLNLQKALGAATHFPFRKIELSNAFEMYRPVTDGWLASL
jgi:UDP-N-acetylglucosamine transferase subunit ALG13